MSFCLPACLGIRLFERKLVAKFLTYLNLTRGTHLNDDLPDSARSDRYHNIFSNLRV